AIVARQDNHHKTLQTERLPYGGQFTLTVRAERAGINLLTLPQDNPPPTGRPVNGFHHKKTNRPDWDGMY
ncbi:hypothetical protein VJV57_16090, partial [Escherichia coli]|uniref:hypothetical protein n=1 Tax=Escherichia coli TaxID=562 RepID=UPI002DBDBBCC